MDPFSHIDNLRQKPEHERRHVAAIVAAIAVVVIFFVWLTITIPRLTSLANESAENMKATADNADTGIKSFQEAWSDVENSVADLKEGVTNLASTTFEGGEGSSDTPEMLIEDPSLETSGDDEMDMIDTTETDGTEVE